MGDKHVTSRLHCHHPFAESLRMKWDCRFLYKIDYCCLLKYKIKSGLTHGSQVTV
jgi:hypothetical protein